MSELPSHGTGRIESEVLLDVVEIFNDWTGDSTPDFSVVQRRLRESFNVRELRNLETVTHALAALIAKELPQRGSNPD
jgi:hypothetical protein